MALSRTRVFNTLIGLLVLAVVALAVIPWLVPRPQEAVRDRPDSNVVLTGDVARDRSVASDEAIDRARPSPPVDIQHRADLMGLGWRVIFLINVPIAVLTFVATLLIIPGSRRPEAPTIDAPGAVGISVSLAAMLLPFVLGRQNGWPVWMWGGPVVGVILLLIVIRMENRRAARGGDPVLDTRVIVIPSLARGLIASVLFMTFFASFMFRLTILLQQGEHIEPLYAGLVFAPSGVTFALSSLLMRGWVAQNRERAVRTGACVTMIGLLIAVLGLTVEALPTVPLIVAAVCATGFGNGLVLPTLIGLALCDVPLAKSGVASGTMTASQQFAASAGVALLGTLYFACSASTGHEHAMAWTLVVDIVLLIAVILVAGLPRRSAIEG